MDTKTEVTNIWRKQILKFIGDKDNYKNEYFTNFYVRRWDGFYVLISDLDKFLTELKILEIEYQVQEISSHGIVMIQLKPQCLPLGEGKK